MLSSEMNRKRKNYEEPPQIIESECKRGKFYEEFGFDPDDGISYMDDESQLNTDDAIIRRLNISVPVQSYEIPKKIIIEAASNALREKKMQITNKALKKLASNCTEKLSSIIQNALNYSRISNRKKLTSEDFDRSLTHFGFNYLERVENYETEITDLTLPDSRNMCINEYEIEYEESQDMDELFASIEIRDADDGIEDDYISGWFEINGGMDEERECRTNKKKIEKCEKPKEELGFVEKGMEMANEFEAKAHLEIFQKECMVFKDL